MKNRHRIEVLVIFMLAACAPGAAVVSSAKEIPQAAGQEPSPEVATDAGWPAWTITSDIPPWPCDVKKTSWKRRSLEVHVSAGDCSISMEPPDERGHCTVEWHESEQLIGDVGFPARDRVFKIGADQEPVICGRRWHCGCDEALPGQEDGFKEGNPPPGRRG